MATLYVELKEHRVERQTVDQIIYTRHYRIPPYNSLDDVSLEEGDFLPGNASAEIINSHTEPDKSKGAPIGSVIAVVTAQEDIVWS